MGLKWIYKRFKAWQRIPRHFSNEGLEEHQCACCGNQYRGNYCPICGQSAKERGITWQSVRKHILMVWGLDSHSFLFSVFQLLFRPGYFIADYISGRRQLSYPPIKMLFIIILLDTIIKQLVGIQNPEMETGDNLTLIIFYWMYTHPQWGLIIFTSFLILPTWSLFHFSPRCTHHSLPQGFFIQMFMDSLLFLIATTCFFFGAKSLFFVPIYYFFSYKQLFGYGIWGTLWRTVLCLVTGLCGLLLAVDIEDFFFEAGFFETYGAANIIFNLVLWSAVQVVSMAGGYWISYWRCKKRKNKPAK